MAKKTRIPQVSDEQIAAMANTGVSDATVDQTVAERAGADDKVAAVAAEGAKPQVSTYTPEARLWIENNKDLNSEGLYGPRGQLAFRPEDIRQRAQFLGRPLTVADMEELHSPDPTAPMTVVNCTVCSKQIESFVRTAMITREGDLMRDKAGNVVYRGQFVVTGKPLTIHAAHTGDCLYKLRSNLGKTKELPNGRKVADLLPSQSFDQANARLAGIQGHFAAKAAENNAFKQRLGAKVGDVAGSHNGGNRRDEFGIDRGAATPRTPRGQSRKQRWAQSDSE
jgi:hypothetical protein